METGPVLIAVRLDTDLELEAAFVDQVPLRARSRFVRNAMRGALFDRTIPTTPQLTAIDDLRCEIASVGVLLNQIARALNSAQLGVGRRVPDADEISNATRQASDVILRAEEILRQWE